jgi:hexokinase
MGGIAFLGLNEASGMGGLILGTGCNSCYVEKGEKIKKLSMANDMIVNCESGNFSGAPEGAADEILDRSSNNPGTFRFEKKMSGVYLGKIVTQLARLAAERGLMSEGFGNPDYEAFAAHEIDSFIRGDDNRICQMCVGDDAKVLHVLVDMCFERAARLVTANIAALCIHTDSGKTPQAPFVLVPEGSVFHGSLLFRSKFDSYLDGYMKEKLGRHVVIRAAENATIAGAALAALLN